MLEDYGDHSCVLEPSPNPCGSKRDGYICKSKQSSGFPLPSGMVEDLLEDNREWDLEDDGHEREKTSCAEIVVERIDGAEIDEIAFCWEKTGNHYQAV